MSNGLEIVAPVVTELLKNAAVSAVKYFRDRGGSEDEARENAKNRLMAAKGTVESAAEDLIGNALPDERKAEFFQLVEESVEQLPIKEGLAIVNLARYSEVPVYRIQQSDEWMSDANLLRTATNHAWVEGQLERCFARMGYGIQKGEQLRGVVNLWSDLIATSATEPAHRIGAVIVCGPDPVDHKTAALLYDMETADLLKQDDWFFLSTHALFNPFVKGIVDRANRRASYSIGMVQAADIQSLLKEKENPKNLTKLLRTLAGVRGGD